VIQSVENFTPGTRAEARREPYPRDEVSIAAVTEVLWRGRIWVLLAVFLTGAAAAGIGFLLPKQYEARVMISPATKDSRESAVGSSLTQELGGLAALAGLSGPTNAFKAESLATLESDILTINYIKEQNLLPILFAAQWDEATHSWRDKDPKKWPTPWQANQFFSKAVRTVVDDKKTGLVSLTIKWKDPVIAAKWANDLVARTNDYMRQRSLEEAETNIAYLKDQVEKNPTVEMKTTIFSLMQVELKTAMLAQGNRQFALKVIDPALPAEKPSGPKPMVWGIAGVMLGFLVSACVLLIRAGRAGTNESR
jgi:uncharacterized protein involved in exopolysaccharide biosynthesis